MYSDVRKKIVIVEDDNLIAVSQAMYLKDHGFDTVELSSGEECVALAASDAVIDLILMDIDLGNGIDGIFAAEKIKELRDVPVVFLTAFSDEDTMKRVNSAEQYGYVVKNTGNLVILSAINMALRLFDSLKVLHESEEKYKFIAENSTDLILKVTSNGKIIYVSPLCKTVLGYDAGELAGSNILHYYDKEDRDTLIDAFNKIIESAGIYTFNHRMRLKDGSYKWFEATGKKLINADGTIRSLITSSRDITARIESEKALKDSDEKFHLVMNGVPALLAYVDNSERFVFVSDGYVRWYGIPKERIIGKYLKEIFLPEEYEKASPFIAKTLAGESIVTDSFTQDKDGAQRYVRGHFIPHIRDGVVHGFFSLIFDITENKKAEEKILSLLNGKDLLLKEVHHRVKNNMGSIAALLYLQMDSMDNPAAVNAIQDARSRVMSMIGIYNILYRSADYKAVPARPYFSDLIDKIAATYITSPRIKIENEIDEMVLDSGILFPLGMIINELLTNAVKYAFTGERPGVIHVRIIRKDDKHVEIIIKDNGVGLPDALEISSSRGIGLTLVRMMIQQIKGSIKINKIGGTEFRIQFPV